MSKPFLLIGSYKTHLPIKEMNREAKAWWKKEDLRRKREERERKKMLLKLWIITERDLLAVGAR